MRSGGGGGGGGGAAAAALAQDVRSDSAGAADEAVAVWGVLFAEPLLRRSKGSGRHGKSWDPPERPLDVALRLEPLSGGAADEGAGGAASATGWPAGGAVGPAQAAGAPLGWPVHGPLKFPRGRIIQSALVSHVRANFTVRAAPSQHMMACCAAAGLSEADVALIDGPSRAGHSE
eukprot:366415-Chlamydomonas_euryale.AAC.1